MLKQKNYTKFIQDLYVTELGELKWSWIKTYLLKWNYDVKVTVTEN